MACVAHLRPDYKGAKAARTVKLRSLSNLHTLTALGWSLAAPATPYIAAAVVRSLQQTKKDDRGRGAGHNPLLAGPLVCRLDNEVAERTSLSHMERHEAHNKRSRKGRGAGVPGGRGLRSAPAAAGGSMLALEAAPQAWSTWNGP